MDTTKGYNLDFSGKVVLLTGGTGSFGKAFIERYLESDIKKIIVFSRDEKKQDDLRFKHKNPKLKFLLGDVRDFWVLEDAVSLNRVDYIFHSAALKQVPSCDFAPLEAVKTNVHGTDNVLRAAIKHKVKKVVCLSTGKAVYPINTMGLTKALMEKVILNRARELDENDFKDTTITFIRYSNIFASRGSAFNIFINQIKNNEAITLTHKEMIRAVMAVDDAVNLALFAMKQGQNGDLFVRKSPKNTMMFIIQTLHELYHASNREIRIIGKRQGEKLEERILTDEELMRIEDMGEFCRVFADRRGLNQANKTYNNLNQRDIKENEAYNFTVPTLTKEEIKQMLIKAGELPQE